MNIDEILSRLEHVKRYSQRSSSWVACCPSHDDKTPSLAVKLLDDGRVLLHCFGGCDVQAICDALDMRMADLMGEAPTEYHHDAKPANRIPATDMLKAMAFDALRVGLMASRMANGHLLADDEKQALLEISGSFQEAVDYITARRKN